MCASPLSGSLSRISSCASLRYRFQVCCSTLHSLVIRAIFTSEMRKTPRKRRAEVKAEHEPTPRLNSTNTNVFSTLFTLGLRHVVPVKSASSASPRAQSSCTHVCSVSVMLPVAHGGPPRGFQLFAQAPGHFVQLRMLASCWMPSFCFIKFRFIARDSASECCVAHRSPATCQPASTAFNTESWQLKKKNLNKKHHRRMSGRLKF